MAISLSTTGRAVIAAAFVLTTLAGASGTAQRSEETAIDARVKVTDADREAAANVKSLSYHVMAASVPGAKQRAAALNAENARRVAEETGKAPDRETAATSTLAKPYFYPADVQKSGGVTLKAAVSHAVYIYINKTGTVAPNWAAPEGFIKNVFADPFIHLEDQYTKSTASNPDSVGGNMSVTYPLYGNEIGEHELWAIAHAAAKKYGAGTGHIYHLFLPNGIDTCFDESSSCYSPDNFVAWIFCAYHEAVTFKDIGTVLFTVQPFQGTDGCAVHSPSPNGVVADSTYSTLSHELFETISDPEPDSGFTNQISLDLQGYEIGDECQPLTDDNGDFLVPTVTINAKKYAIQLEYSNTYHACAAQP